MPILADYHMHTHHSGDNDSQMIDMVERAMELGLKDICITEHHDYDYVYVIPDDDEMFTLDFDAYYKEYVQIAEKFRDKINVQFGVELGVQDHIGDELRKIVSSHPFDFVIASSHLCHRKDTYFPYFFEGRRDTEAFLEYFQSIYENICAFNDYDVYGHLDYVVRYAPERDKNYRYADYALLLDDILGKIISDGHGLEINTGGLRKGLKNTNPSIDILKRYREMGGEIITVASDAHSPEEIGSHFLEAAEILKESGFKNYTIFKERKPIFKPL